MNDNKKFWGSIPLWYCFHIQWIFPWFRYGYKILHVFTWKMEDNKKSEYVYLYGYCIHIEKMIPLFVHYQHYPTFSNVSLLSSASAKAELNSLSQTDPNPSRNYYFFHWRMLSFKNNFLSLSLPLSQLMEDLSKA